MEAIVVAFVVAVAIIIAIGAGRAYARKARAARLLAKYGDAEVVQLIMASKVWQGMSEGQLIDSWGTPADIDEKVYKTKTTRTFKYDQTGKNRFNNRVKLEDGYVVGWDQK